MKPTIKTTDEIRQILNLDYNEKDTKWLLVKDEIEFLKRQHYLLIEHFEKMHQLRKLEDVSKIQEKYWHSLYLGYIVEMQRDIEQRIKQLEGKK